MKKFWKILGITALAAAVPVRFRRDGDNKKFQSLLLSVDVCPNEDGKGAEIGINLGEGLISDAVAGLVGDRRETVHFADDEPEAAVVEPILEEAPVEEEPAAGEEPAGPVATEDDFDPEL